LWSEIARSELPALAATRSTRFEAVLLILLVPLVMGMHPALSQALPGQKLRVPDDLFYFKRAILGDCVGRPFGKELSGEPQIAEIAL
jgi:hypothetical protein